MFDIGGNKYKAKVIVGTTTTDSMVLYDVVQFKPATFTIKNETLRKAAISTNTEEATDTGFRDNAIITEKNSVVNRDYMQNEKNNSKVQEKFSLQLPVEETKDLIAVHNLSQEDLLKTLKLGGFPMPSVAIVKAQNGHNEFGDISVIFDKNTIDPSKSGNKVYGGDVLTPTFPDVNYEISLENAVKTMLSEESKNNGMFSVSGVWAAAAKRYNSISEIKEDSSRLKNLSQKEFETIRDGFGKRLNEIADSITDTKIKNPLIARQSAMSQIVDAINTSRTKSGMLRALQQYNPKATEMTVQDIIDLVNDISNMPTEYFEAKPRRAVGLDEIRAILIPSNASEDLKTALSDYNTVEYEADNTDDRVSKLNSLNDLKFSLAVDDKNYEKPIAVEDVDILRSIGRKSIVDFSSEDIQKSQKWAYKFYKELGTKSPFFRAWFGDWRAKSSVSVPVTDMVQRTGKNPRGQYKNTDTGWVISSSGIGYSETISHSGKSGNSVIAMQNIDKIIENAVLLDTEVSEYGRGKKSIYTAFMHKFYAPITY